MKVLQPSDLDPLDFSNDGSASGAIKVKTDPTSSVGQAIAGLGGGGLASVTSDNTLNGDGTPGNPLSVASVLPSPGNAGDVLTVSGGAWASLPSTGGNVADMITSVTVSGTDLDFTGQNGAFSGIVDLSGLPYGLGTVATGGGISGDGTVGNPVSMAGVGAANAGDVFVADGAGSGSWSAPASGGGGGTTSADLILTGKLANGTNTGAVGTVALDPTKTYLWHAYAQGNVLIASTGGVVTVTAGNPNMAVQQSTRWGTVTGATALDLALQNALSGSYGSIDLWEQ